MILVILAGLALALVWTPIRDAEPSLSLRVGLYENEPKIYRDSAGRPAGLFPVLLEAVAERANWHIDWIDCQWQECLERLQQGELDLMPDVAASGARRAHLDFHEVPVVQAWSQIYRLPNAGLNSLQELAGLRVALLAGSVQQEYFEVLNERENLNLTLVLFADMAEVMASVGAGQADAAVANHFYGRFHAAEHQLVETPLTFDQVSLYFVSAGGATTRYWRPSTSTCRAGRPTPARPITRR